MGHDGWGRTREGRKWIQGGKLKLKASIATACNEDDEDVFMFMF